MYELTVVLPDDPFAGTSIHTPCNLKQKTASYLTHLEGEFLWRILLSWVPEPEACPQPMNYATSWVRNTRSLSSTNGTTSSLCHPTPGLLSAGFPYQSIQGTVIQLVTVALPTAGLSLWAASGVLANRNFGRLLARFVAPASITMGAAGSMVYWYFWQETGRIPYAQLALTYTLVFAGLALVIFVRPPIRPLVGGPQHSDPRPTAMVLVLLVLFLVVAGIPFTEELLKLSWLEEPHHYLVVALAVVGWALFLRFLWLLMPVEGRAGRPGFWDWIAGRSKRRSGR